jgi:hypothetical protein
VLTGLLLLALQDSDDGDVGVVRVCGTTRACRQEPLFARRAVDLAIRVPGQILELP